MARKEIGPRAALDTSALIAYANGDNDAVAIIEALSKRNAAISIPAPVLAESLRGGAKDAAINRVLNKHFLFFPVGTTPEAARIAGSLLGGAKAAPSLTIDALIIATAIDHGATAIVTADTSDHEALAPEGFTVIPLH